MRSKYPVRYEFLKGLNEDLQGKKFLPLRDIELVKGVARKIKEDLVEDARDSIKGLKSEIQAIKDGELREDLIIAQTLKRHYEVFISLVDKYFWENWGV